MPCGKQTLPLYTPALRHREKGVCSAIAHIPPLPPANGGIAVFPKTNDTRNTGTVVQRAGQLGQITATGVITPGLQRADPKTAELKKRLISCHVLHCVRS